MAQSRKLYWCSVCFAMDTAKFLADVAPKKTSPGFQNVSRWVTNLNKLKLVVLLMLILNLRIFCGTICLYLSVVSWKTHFFSWGKTPRTSATPKHAEKRSNRVNKRPQIFFNLKARQRYVRRYITLKHTSQQSECGETLDSTCKWSSYDLADYRGIPRNKSITWLQPEPSAATPSSARKTNKPPYLSYLRERGQPELVHTSHVDPCGTLICQSETKLY